MTILMMLISHCILSSAVALDWKIQNEISSAKNSKELEIAVQNFEKLRLFTRACEYEIEWLQAPVHCFFVLNQQRQNGLVSEEEHLVKTRQLDRLCRQSTPQSVVKLKAMLENRDLSSSCRESLTEQLSIGLYKSEGDLPTF